MENLSRRLERINVLLTKSTIEIDRVISFDHDRFVESDTGFVPYYYRFLAEVVEKLDAIIPKNTVSLDLGTGHGAWALMTAAAGFQSYGIDVNPYLIQKARENHISAVDGRLIEPDVACRFAVGNIYSEEYRLAYQNYVYDALAPRAEDDKRMIQRNTMPLDFEGNPYEELGISIRDVGLIYCYVWADQMGFLCDFLEKETNQDAIFVLPYYGRWYGHGVVEDRSGQFDPEQSPLKLRSILPTDDASLDDNSLDDTSSLICGLLPFVGRRVDGQ